MSFGLWLAFSRYGKLVFGGDSSKKDYSEFSWGAMLFTSGLGVGIVLMAFVEPIAFLSNPPFHLEPMSDTAYEYAHMYSQFLWGIPGWLAYTPGIVAVAYFLYNRKANGAAGVVIDVVVTAATVGGISTPLGLGVPTLTGVLTALTGWPESTRN